MTKTDDAVPNGFRNLEAKLQEMRRNQDAMLVAEIDIGRAMHEKLHDAIEASVSEYGALTVAKALVRVCPSVLVLYLSATARFLYSDGEFWRHVGSLGKVPQAQNILRENLPLCLRRAGYHTFADVHVSEAAFRYVTPILIHACVPAAYLGKYFQRIVYSVARDASKRELRDEELRAELVEACHTAQLPRVIRRFLQYGGPFAIDFTRRAADLLADVSADDSLVARDPADLAQMARLPKWVVEGFFEWWHSRERKQNEAHPEEVFRWIRPHVVLDPFGAGGAGLHLALPAQKIDRPRSLWSWRIGGPSGEVPARVTWRDNDSWLVAGRKAITQSESLDVELLCDGKPMRRRAIEDLAAPVRFFDARNGRQTEFGPRPLWVLLAPGWTPTDDTRVTARFPEPGGHLAGYTLIEIDGSEKGGLALKRPDGTQATWKPLMATLTGVSVLPTPLVFDERETPVYADALPRLTFSGDVTDREGWWLRFNAPRGVRRNVPLSELPVQQDAGGAWLDLLELLDDDPPAGDYEVVVSGSLGSKWHGVFRYAPGLQVQAPSALEPAQGFRVVVPAGCKVLPAPGVERKPAIGEAHFLTLKDGVRVGQFEIEAKGFRWTYNLRTAKPIFEASGLAGLQAGDVDVATHFSWDLGQVLEAHYPKLRVDVSPWSDELDGGELTLILRDGDGPCAPPLKLGAKVIQQIELDKLDWRALKQPSSTLDLELWRGGREVAAARVATVRQGWQPEGLTIRSGNDEDIPWVELSWSEGRALRNRAFEIHALTRPWEPALRLLVPDYVTEGHRFTGVSLVPGYYAIEPFLLDPWGDSPAAPLPGRSVAVLRTWFGADAQREHLEKLGEDWLGTLERGLHASWEMAPEGPPFLSLPMPPLSTDGEVAAAWTWYLRSASSPQWEELRRALLACLRESPGEVVLKFAAAAQQSESVAAALLQLGCLAYPSNIFLSQDDAQRSGVARAFPDLAWMWSPGKIAPLRSWEPWHVRQIQLFYEGRLAEMAAVWERFVPDPDERQLADMRLFQHWGKNIRDYEAAIAWHRIVLRDLGIALKASEMPLKARWQLERFDQRHVDRWERTNLLFSVLGIALLNRLAAQREVPPSPELCDWSYQAYDLFGDLFLMACAAWEDFLIPSLVSEA